MSEQPASPEPAGAQPPRNYDEDLTLQPPVHENQPDDRDELPNTVDVV